MTMAPEASETAGDVPGPVRVVGDVAARWLYGRDWRVRVLSSYSVPTASSGHAGLPGSPSHELHSLADAVSFVCAGCLEWCEATLVAVRYRCLVCPGCFSVQAQAGAAQVRESGEGSLTSPVRAGSRRRAPWTLHAVRPCRGERARFGWSPSGEPGV